MKNVFSGAEVSVLEIFRVHFSQEFSADAMVELSVEGTAYFSRYCVVCKRKPGSG